MRICWYYFLFLMFIINPADSAAQGTDIHLLTLEDAKRIAEAAEAYARENDWTVAIAIVDAGGHLVVLRRIDGTQTASIDIAIRKARTSVFYKRPTRIFEERVASGENALLALPDMMPFEGGVPVILEGYVVAGIGVSGVTAEQDGRIAQAGMDAL